MRDEYQTITPEEIEAENTFREGKARIQNNDIEGGKKLLRIAMDMFRNCDSSDAQAKANEAQNLLNQYGG